jgi:hypothetical protein
MRAATPFQLTYDASLTFPGHSLNPQMISLVVNSQSVQFDVDPDTPLLWVLRDHLNLTGTKFGSGRRRLRQLRGACQRRGDALVCGDGR